MNRFEGRKVLVTGAGSGIGQAVVLRLLGEGATIVAADIDRDGLQRTADIAGEDKLRTVTVDVSSADSVAALYDTALPFLGGLDVLVNVAGVHRQEHTHAETLEQWNRVIGINLTGVFLMTRQGLPALLESGRGVVVNFSSTSAYFAHPWMAAYSASKGGVAAFTHAIALEYVKQGLRAVNIVPGGIRTPLVEGVVTTFPADVDYTLLTKQMPAVGGDLGAPADVAGVVAMVASDDGKFITGTEIRVDGGAHM